MTSIESSPSRGAPDGSLRPVDLARPRGGASRSGGAARGRSRRRGADAEPTPSSTSVPESSEPARPDVLPRLSAGEPDAAQELLDRYSGLVWSLARYAEPLGAGSQPGLHRLAEAARWDVLR